MLHRLYGLWTDIYHSFYLVKEWIQPHAQEEFLIKSKRTTRNKMHFTCEILRSSSSCIHLSTIRSCKLKTCGMSVFAQRNLKINTKKIYNLNIKNIYQLNYFRIARFHIIRSYSSTVRASQSNNEKYKCAMCNATCKLVPFFTSAFRARIKKKLKQRKKERNTKSRNEGVFIIHS